MEPVADTFAFIPLVIENDSKVNGYILAKISNGIELIYSLAKDYKAFSYQSDSITLNDATKFVLTVLQLNEKVFGINKYQITDTALFTNDPEHDKVKEVVLGGRLFGASCESITWFTQHCGTPAYCREHYGIGKCDNCGTYCWPVANTIEVCTSTEIIWPAGGIGVTPNGGGPETGGGGPETGEIPHYYPCTPNNPNPETPPVPLTSTNNVTDPGDCPEPGPGDGWAPLPLDEPEYHNPCDTLNKYKQGQDFNAIWQLLKAEVPTRHEQLYIFNNLLEPISPTNPVYMSTGAENEFGVYPYNNESWFTGSWGWFHNHFADEDSAGLIFSAGDLNVLAEQVVRDNDFFQVDYKRFMIGVVADSGAQYILIVDDINKFTNWATNLMFNENMIEIAYNGAGLNQGTLPLSVKETERRFLKLIQNTGLKLFRGSADFQTWTPIELTHNGNTITEFPCPN